MRKLLLSVLAATAATCVAVPASAQYYHRPPAPTPVAMQEMQARVQDIRAHIRNLRERGMIGWREAQRFDYDASRIDREIWGKSRQGLSSGLFAGARPRPPRPAPDTPPRPPTACRRTRGYALPR